MNKPVHTSDCFVPVLRQSFTCPAPKLILKVFLGGWGGGGGKNLDFRFARSLSSVVLEEKEKKKEAWTHFLTGGYLSRPFEITDN